MITVKTYPNISKKYAELVCTAGVREDGSWIRIYPVPFRLLSGDKQFKKYDVIKVPIRKNKSDIRIESYKIENSEEIEIVEHIDTENNWQKRKDYIFKNKIYTNMRELTELNKQYHISLATFKPCQILKIYAEDKKCGEYWTKDEIIKYTNANKSLFCDNFDLKNMPKIPYNFKISFKDNSGYIRDMIILDWEISQLYSNYRHVKKYSKENSKNKVLDKLQELAVKDLYLFLGTTNKYDGWATNPFTIIGLFYPKKAIYNPTLF
ncbi:MAG: hypothetical protein LBP40_03375 [Campylobacteraceae bacterium]|nr:hypothetical protein [Campylobacteraceae bacterium]